MDDVQTRGLVKSNIHLHFAYNFSPFCFTSLSCLHCIPQYYSIAYDADIESTSNANATNVPTGPTSASIGFIKPTPTAAILHLTRLLIAIQLVPFPVKRLHTSVVLIANTALDAAAIRNWRKSGRVIQAGSAASKVDVVVGWWAGL